MYSVLQASGGYCRIAVGAKISPAHITGQIQCQLISANRSKLCKHLLHVYVGCNVGCPPAPPTSLPARHPHDLRLRRLHQLCWCLLLHRLLWLLLLHHGLLVGQHARHLQRRAG